MPKVKVVVFWIFSLLALLGGVAAYFELKNSKRPEIDALQALPDSCMIYLSTAELHELENKINQRNLITDQLRLLPEAAELFEALHMTDSLLNHTELVREQLQESRFHVGIYPTSHWLMCFTISELGQEEKVKEELKTLLSADQKENYLHFRCLKQSLYCSLNKGLVRISPSLPLLKLSESNSGRLADSQKFRQFLSTLTENKLLTVYADQTLLSKQKRVPALALNLAIKQGFFSAATEVSPSELRINGFQSADSAEYFSWLLGQKKSRTADVFSHLPASTAWFEAFACHHFTEIAWREGETEKEWWKEVNNKALFNVQKQFYESCSDGLYRFAGQAGHISTAVLLNDSTRMEESLVLMADSTWRKDSLSFYRLSTTTSLQFFSPFVKESAHFATRIGNTVFFSEQLPTLYHIAAELKHGYCLSSNEDLFSYSRQNLPENFHYLLYTSPLQQTTYPAALIRTINTSKAYDNFRHLSYSLTGEKNYFKMRFHLMLQMGDAKQKILWTTKLDTTCSSRPVAFVNHNTNENEVLIQDDANTLYLINAKGQVLWKKALEEKIISAVERVDIYKNEKFQLLFNTRNRLHLVDRNGKDLPNFPVRLPGATAGLSVFDYEGTRDYRVLIPCANKTIYNFTLDGQKLEGFSPVKTNDLVELPVQYVTVGASQYLVAVDRVGTIYTFSRKGLGRIGLKNRVLAGCRNFYTDAGSNTANTQLVYLDDQTGMLHKISFTDVQHLSKLSMETSGANLSFSQIDDNRSVDVLVAAEQQVAAYDFSGTLIFEQNTDAAVTSADYLADESHALLLLFSKEKDRVEARDLLRHTDKKVNATAPALAMDLFKDRHYYLLVPNGKELSCVPLK